MKTTLLCAAAVLGLAFMASTQVEAGHGNRCGSNYRNSYSNNYSNNYSNSSRYGNYNNYNNYNRRSNGYSYRSPSYHNTSHYDYRGPSLQRHSSHLDFVPGHYDYHRTGHYGF
ncbi:MAG: hypothetical protein JKY95_15540 [Planctomycetaceae bacterium]|nr:hypothetical protein [Planctomycetaceae bacterium]